MTKNPLPFLSFTSLIAIAWSATTLLTANLTGQCQLAAHSSYGTGNPVILHTVAPGEYLVPGESTYFRAQNTSTSIDALVVSPQAVNVALGSPFVGSLLVNPISSVILLGFGAHASWGIPVPSNNALLGQHYYFQSFHEQNGVFATSNGLDLRIGLVASDVAITGIDMPSSVVGGHGPRSFVVHFQNHGPAPATFVVNVTIGGTGGTGASGTASVAGNGSGTVTIQVPIPGAFGPFGTSVPFTVVASTGFVDCNPANNLTTETVQIEVPYWDLRLSMVNVPSSVFVPGSGTWITYQVRATNHGNVTSGNYGFFTQITNFPGSNYTNPVNGPLNFNGLPVGPGNSDTFTVNYFVPGGVFRNVQQWVKAQITWGCVVTAGNFTQTPIVFL